MGLHGCVIPARRNVTPADTKPGGRIQSRISSIAAVSLLKASYTLLAQADFWLASGFLLQITETPAKLIKLPGSARTGTVSF